jgi:hypothetical protein
VTARASGWVFRACAWGLLTAMAAAPAYHLIVALYVHAPGVWAALLAALAALVALVASGVAAEFGPAEPEPDDVEAWRTVELGGAS